ncbi:MAG: Tripartite tricarboxylate transporter TctB family [Rhodobacteraceae bacterium HLUCCO07]|nr:MAG: Tripartite tricarboxylate transporter TctB family [Rhodobacteraceae bacterium HLUCCO07]
MAVARGHSDFQDRLKRIEKRGAGRAQVFNAADGLKPEIEHRVSRRKTTGFLTVPFALVLGALSLIVARLAIFRYGGLPEEFAQPDYEMAAQAGLALAMVLLLAIVFNLMRKRHLLASVIGIALAMTAMHNLVHMAPGEWAKVFSPQWVSEIRETTEPNTLEFRGARFKLG